jgi:hypothetical protein
MERIAEGLTLSFLGVLVIASVYYIGADKFATHLVARSCAVILFVMAGVSLLNGAQSAIFPMKLCPYIKSAVGIMYLIDSNT